MTNIVHYCDANKRALYCNVLSDFDSTAVRLLVKTHQSHSDVTR